jgi:hypothetical protein
MQGPARTAVLSGLFCFLAGQALLLGLLECGRPFLRDPEFDRRLSFLRARQAERPGRPLILLLGSSRMGMSIRPDRLAVNRSPSASPLVFNFGCTGTTPLTQLAILHRLLDQGIHPDVILLEVWPLHLGLNREQMQLMVNEPTLNARDLRLLGRYTTISGERWLRWCRRQLPPCFGNREVLVTRLGLLLGLGNDPPPPWTEVDDWGWLALSLAVTHDPGMSGAVLKRFLDSQAPLFTPFQLGELAELALQDILTLCRREKIATTLLLLPEAAEARRRWSTPANERALQTFLTRLAQTHNVGVIDTRDWLPDCHFVDGVHLTHEGARHFTDHFERRLLPSCRRAGGPPAS